MEIKKTQNTIIGILTEDDFEKYEIYPSDFKDKGEEYVTSRINDAILDIIKEAKEEELLNSTGALNVSCQITNNTITLIIKKEMPSFNDFLDAFLQTILKNHEAEQEATSSNTYRIIEFGSLSELLSSIEVLKPLKICDSSVLKYNKKIYLKLTISEDIIENTDIVLSEFFKTIISNDMKIAMIDEHAEIIVDNNAIEKLFSL